MSIPALTFVQKNQDFTVTQGNKIASRSFTAVSILEWTEDTTFTATPLDHIAHV